MSDSISVKCPHCGCSDVREKNVAYCEAEVVAWEWDAANNQPMPADYDMPFSADWEVDDVANQYVCHECRWEGTLDELKVERPASPETTTPAT